MSHLWRVAVFEYRRNVFKKGFLFAILCVPFFVTLSVGLGLFLESRKDKTLSLGYVDQASVLVDARADRPAGQDLKAQFIAYSTQAAAQAALERGEIQAYFLLPARYIQTRQVDMVYIRRPSENAWGQFFNFLQISLLADKPPEIAYRLAAGAEVTVRSVDGMRQVSRGGPTFGLLMPLFIALAFLFLLLISSGYIMEAVTEEKENQTMEILITSISPMRLMSGKILGIVGTSLTLLLAWTVELGMGIFITAQIGVGWFSNLSMDWRTVLATVAIAIPAYVLAAALMIAFGTLVTTSREAQSAGTIFIILHILPLYVSWLFIKSPHHPIGVILSLMPFTALMTTAMRNLFIIVPAWQVIASVVVQAACVLAAIGFAGRALRSGMLGSGQRLNWRSLMSKYHGSAVEG